MASDTNNKLQVDYLKVKQLINNLKDSSFLEFLKVDLREYNADDINEAHIVNTVKLTSDEDSEFQDVFSIFEQKVVQIDVLPVIFKAEATPFTPKGKEIKPNLSSPNMNKKKKKVAFISKTSSTSTSYKTSKKQPASIPAD
ncbi:uncharacterized protein OCT59_016639 [Rhizophagus irregularis]|uniref:uncharacterized protein n=1 Tax=Rhizophagus irregularis TaxID=588596 RepID=UPI00331C0431|nr:hypothetical protein OCT59_016639 [Rhizophagus irregularis]